MELPTYDGNLHIEDFLDWVQQTEQFFDYMEVPKYKQVKLMSIKLRGMTAAWWEQTQCIRRREDKKDVVTWAKMKQLLRQKFLPRRLIPKVPKLSTKVQNMLINFIN